jgi:activator of HSP90 ATPase
MNAPDPPDRPSPTRRRLIGGAVLVAAGAAGGAAALAGLAAAPRCSTGSHGRTALRQVVDFEARPPQVYAALMSSEAFAAFTGMPAAIEPTAGGAVSLFGGLVVGRNIELAPGRRIVQAWRPVQDFPSGVYSLVKMELSPAGAGTRLVLDHSGFPEGHYDHLDQGWPPRYWLPLKRYLAAHAGASS